MNGVDCTERLKESFVVFRCWLPFFPSLKFLSTFPLSIYFTSLGFFYLISFCHQIRLFLRCEKETEQSKLELQTYQERKNKNLSFSVSHFFPLLTLGSHKQTIPHPSTSFLPTRHPKRNHQLLPPWCIFKYFFTEVRDTCDCLGKNARNIAHCCHVAQRGETGTFEQHCKQQSDKNHTEALPVFSLLPDPYMTHKF